MTTGATPGLDRAEKVAEKAFWSPTVSLGLAAFFVKVPWLAWQPMKSIMTYLFELFAECMWGKGKLVIDMGAIKFLNAKHQADFENAQVELLIIEQEKGNESEEFKNALNDVEKKYSDSMRFIGTDSK